MAPEEEPYEYLFEWTGIGPPPNPFDEPVAASSSGFPVTGGEIQLLCSALFFAVGGGPVPPDMKAIAASHRRYLKHLSEECHHIRDAAWFHVEIAGLGRRADVLRARMQVRTQIRLSREHVPVLVALLDACRDDWIRNGDMPIVTGASEYGVAAEDFSALRARLEDWVRTVDRVHLS